MTRFGRFSFRASDGELRRDGTVVKLQPQPARVLAVLVEQLKQDNGKLRLVAHL